MVKNLTIITALTLLAVLTGCKKENESTRNVIPSYRPEEAKPQLPDFPITATGRDYSRVMFSICYASKGESDLCSIGSDGKNFKKLASTVIVSPIRVSPNGKRYTFKGACSEYGECQTVYDEEKDTLIFLEKPYGLGWYPRWWDDDNIYYRSTDYVYLQNIHTGISKQMHSNQLRVWLDPVWVPELNKFVNVEARRICTFNRDGSNYQCDSLPLRHSTDFPPVKLVFNGKIAFGFTTDCFIKRMGEPLLPPNYILVDLDGRILFETVKTPAIKWSVSSITCDNTGNWLYYIENVCVEFDCTYVLKRRLLSDPESEEIIFTITKGKGALEYLSVTNK